MLGKVDKNITPAGGETLVYISYDGGTTWVPTKGDAFGNFSVFFADLATRVAEDSGDTNVTYIGKAAIGTLTSVASWKIKKLDSTSGLVITYADGNSNFDNIWDNRESLSYS